MLSMALVVSSVFQNSTFQRSISVCYWNCSGDPRLCRHSRGPTLFFVNSCFPLYQHCLLVQPLGTTDRSRIFPCAFSRSLLETGSRLMRGCQSVNKSAKERLTTSPAVQATDRSNAMASELHSVTFCHSDDWLQTDSLTLISLDSWTSWA